MKRDPFKIVAWSIIAVLLIAFWVCAYFRVTEALKGIFE